MDQTTLMLLGSASIACVVCGISVYAGVNRMRGGGSEGPKDPATQKMLAGALASLENALPKGLDTPAWTLTDAGAHAKKVLPGWAIKQYSMHMGIGGSSDATIVKTVFVLFDKRESNTLFIGYAVSANKQIRVFGEP